MMLKKYIAPAYSSIERMNSDFEYIFLKDKVLPVASDDFYYYCDPC